MPKYDSSDARRFDAAFKIEENRLRMKSISKRKVTLVLALLALILLIIYVVMQILTVRGTFAPMRSASEAGGAAVVAGIAEHRVAGRVYLSGSARPEAPLIVVLHGDAPTRKPSYQYDFASQVADAAPGTRVVALLRPGYADPFGGRSDGDRGLFSAGENYTPDVVHSLAEAIRELKVRWSAPSVILVGHSGGAVLTADIAALNPGLVQQAYLISCPCDVPAFRRHMAHLQRSPVWMLPVNSLSPLQTLNRMKTDVKVTAISGANDPLALPEYAKAYVAQAQAQGIPASMLLIPDKGHEILLMPDVAHEVARAAQTGH